MQKTGGSQAQPGDHSAVGWSAAELAWEKAYDATPPGTGGRGHERISVDMDSKSSAEARKRHTVIRWAQRQMKNPTAEAWKSVPAEFQTSRRKQTRQARKSGSRYPGGSSDGTRPNMTVIPAERHSVERIQSLDLEEVFKLMFEWLTEEQARRVNNLRQLRGEAPVPAEKSELGFYTITQISPVGQGSRSSAITSPFLSIQPKESAPGLRHFPNFQLGMPGQWGVFDEELNRRMVYKDLEDNVVFAGEFITRDGLPGFLPLRDYRMAIRAAQLSPHDPEPEIFGVFKLFCPVKAVEVLVVDWMPGATSSDTVHAVPQISRNDATPPSQSSPSGPNFGPYMYHSVLKPFSSLRGYKHHRQNLIERLGINSSGRY